MIKNNPLFSIIIPVFNREKFIEKSVKSVISQTYDNWELIVIDDASNDGTTKILERIKDKKIKIIRNEKNIERSATRNRGIKLAKGEYICFLDSDDYYLPNHLSNLNNRIINSVQKVAVYATNCIKITPLGKHYIDLKRDPKFSSVEQVIRHHIPCISVAIHRRILNRYQFDEYMFINEDVDLFARIAVDYPILYIPERTVVWRIHDDNTKCKIDNYIKPQIDALKRLFNDNTVTNQISAKFKREMLSEKYAELSTYYLSKNNRKMALLYAIKSNLNLNKKAGRSAVAAVIYSVPFLGRIFKSGAKKYKKLQF